MVGDVRRFSEREELSASRPPSPPDGLGPILEWFRSPRGSGRIAVSLAVFAIALALTLETRSLEWMTWWWPWAIAGGAALLLHFSGRPMVCAGADWFKCDRKFVKTYELVSVKVSRTSPGDSSWHLDLKDAAGRKTTTQLKEFQYNPLLWDLVYNGILHSVRNGAKTNRDSREYLSLRPDRP